MSSDKVSTNLRVYPNDANGTWIACVKLPDGHSVHSENMDRHTAIVEAKTLARDYEASKKIGVTSPKLDSNTGKWTISTDDSHTAGLGYEIDPNSNYTVAQHASHLQKIMTGLVEKAKREGLDGRLLAMANTDFERGFMALSKALTTNKG